MRPIDGIKDPLVREVLKDMSLRLLRLGAKLDQITRGSIGATGRVRTGPPSQRGVAADRHPEVFIQVDTAGGTAKFFHTSPTDTAGGGFDWVEDFSVDLA